ncbi:MAG TPA: LuxR C-terminal-related transcriptional regulator [Gaiellaceae bacterium]
MATARERRRCRERLGQLDDSSLDCESVEREAIALLQGVVGFDRWCWPLCDPQALVPLSGCAEHDFGPGVGRALELEYSGGDFATMGELARRPMPAASLSAATHGDLARSPRWDEVLRPVGIGDEAIVACRDAVGCWGWIKAYRDGGDAAFGDDDLELLADVGPTMGSALRRRFDAATRDTGVGAPDSPGVVVLDDELRAVSWTAGAREWIASLPLADLWAAWGILPAVVYPVAALARSRDDPAGAHALERAVDGRWVRIEAARLEGQAAAQVAVTLRAATAAETFDLLCRAYALSSRERDVVAALLAGLDTRAVSQRLFISPHTVQDHLKSVFRKAGVRGRRELLARFSGATEQREPSERDAS